jgi:hypothetical protein
MENAIGILETRLETERYRIKLEMTGVDTRIKLHQAVQQASRVEIQIQQAQGGRIVE